MMMPRKFQPSALLGILALLATALLPLPLSANPANPTTLLAVRQVLLSQAILPEDIRVARRSDGLFFEDAEVTGKVPEGTALLKVAKEDGADRLRLYVVDFSKPDHLESVLTESGLSVFCDFRAYRQCFTRPSETAVEYLPHAAVLTAGRGKELIYLRYPSGGSIIARHPGVKLLASSHAHGQFKGEVDMSVLKCTSFGVVEFPRQFDTSSFSIVDGTEGELRFCEVTPPLVTGKQVVALTGTKRAPRIYCEKGSRKLLYFEPFLQTGDANVPHSQSMELKLTGQPATCDLLSDSEDHVFAVKRFDPVHGKLSGEKLFSFTSVAGRKAFVPEVQHEAPLACYKLKLPPLRGVEREALLMKIHGSNIWMEVPVGTVLARPEEDKHEDILKLYSYQPTFTSSDIHVTELRAMADDSDLGPAVISTAEVSNGSSVAMLYQRPDAKMISIGYLQHGLFVGGSNLTFFTTDALNGKNILEYKLRQLQRGSSLSLSSVPEGLALQRDIVKYNTAPHGLPAVGREAEDMLAMYHRLRDYFSSNAGEQGLDDAVSEISNKICGGRPRTVIVNWTYADSSGQFSVTLRLPVNILDSPTSRGLIQQLQIALSLILEDTTALPRALANRTTFYGTAISTLYKILESGHCSSCPNGKTECNFCRAIMFRDFVYVKIQGLEISKKTMPDSFSWAEYRGQDFLTFAETSSGSALLGVEMDFHTNILTRGSPSRKHLHQLKAYATTCLNAHISSMVLRERSNSSSCPGLDPYLKNIVQTAPVEEFTSLMNGADFRDAVTEGCNVRLEDAVTSCINGDGEMLGLQRLPELRGDGRNSISEYIRSLLFPVLFGSIEDQFEAVDLSNKPSVLAAAPQLSQLLTVLQSASKNNKARPAVDYLFRDEAKDQAVAVSSGIDAAVAAKGHKPSLGSTFYVSLWYRFKWGLKLLEDILDGPETIQRDAEIVREVQAYAGRLMQQHPQKYSVIVTTLSWPENKLPENVSEAQNFVGAATGVVLVPGAILNLFDHHWNSVSSDVSRNIPERHVAEGVLPFTQRISYANPDMYGQVCKRLGWTSIRQPSNSEEAEAFVSALREVRALTGPVKKWIIDAGEPVSDTATWGQIRAIIDKAHGPHTKVPLFLPSSSKCQCVRSAALDRCYIDAVKTTEDVVFRMTLLFPPVIAGHVKRNAKTLTPEAAALCTSAGIFVTAWQQHQVEAGFEHPNGRLAHSLLIDRLKNAGDYTLSTIDDNGVEDTSAYNRTKKALNRVFSINSGAKVAFHPAGIDGRKTAARSLYGGIVNTVGMSAIHIDHFVQQILALGINLPRRARPPHPLAGLFAALRVSQRFKDCFGASKEMTFRAWYLMHLEGDNILRRVNSHKLGEEIASATYNFATGPGSAIFDEAFKTLMATVTTQWEDSNVYKSLIGYSPGKGAIRIPEVAPEDFETPADNQEMMML
ncbi:hypothetical protein EBH_0009100 [Eimeria brunetti]|uniref:Uncharacterized protein n=1 Tax=Eimeria brunetti TaxID=51314 RepID=U6LUY2_9EIME|nr:hypothetical protein EBH_0009100 [Eimeria brunetti]